MLRHKYYLSNKESDNGILKNSIKSKKADNK